MHKWMYVPAVSGRGKKKSENIVSIADTVTEMGKQVNPGRLKVLSSECFELEPLVQDVKLKLTRLLSYFWGMSFSWNILPPRSPKPSA